MPALPKARQPSQGSALAMVVGRAREVPVYACFFLVTVGLQWLGGAFQREFSGADEGAHYVTGLMVHDYLEQAVFTNPMEYAESYYVHYPRVAIGHWPPVFYVVEAAWIFVFGEARSSLLLLMALITTLFASGVFWTIRGEHGFLIGLGMGLLVICLPVVQASSSMVMIDVLLALLILWAALCFGKYLDTGRWQHATAFGLLASVALLTKANGLCLALLPPLAVLISRRWRLLATFSFWIPALIVLALCGPWYYRFGMLLATSGLHTAWLEFALRALAEFSRNLIRLAGIVPALLALTGVVLQVKQPGKMGGKRTALLAAFFSVVAFHVLIPSSTNVRYLILTVPAILLFLADGLAWVVARVRWNGFTPPLGKAVALGLLAIIFAGEAFMIPANSCYGYGDPARMILQRPEFDRSVILLASDPNGESAFISEIAMAEERPGHIVLRASKVLASHDWINRRYKLKYESPRALQNMLETLPVGIVIIDTAVPEASVMPHQHQLVEAIESNPQCWTLLDRYAVTRGGIRYPNAVEVYSLIGHENRPHGPIRIDMQFNLGRDIELGTPDNPD